MSEQSVKRTPGRAPELTPELMGAIEVAVEALRSGECIGMPTETVYGLAADALNPNAVARVFETKRRPAFDPLIVHVTPEMDIDAWVELNDTARRLMNQFWPGPLTLLVTKRALISDLVTSGHPTVALRCPAHPVARALLNAFGGPLVAPSANLFGQLSPTSAAAVRAGLGDAVRVVLDGGPCEVGLESTIVDSTATPPELPILRLGGVAPERLSALGYHLSYPTPIIGQAPGTLKNHYAPSIPLYLIELDELDELDESGGSNGPDHASTDQPLEHAQYQEADPQKLALLGWRDTRPEFGVSEVLSPSGDSTEAAARVFALLRALSERGCEGIVATLPPPEGLGRAIRDRLKRGASGYARFERGVWRLPQLHPQSPLEDH